VLVATKTARFGTVLSATSGAITRTVYTLTPSKVACSAKCLQYWPEVLLAKGAKKPTAGAGVSASKLGTITRAGGRLQVTYAGKALYWFSKDTSQGQVSGNVSDTWGKWTDVVLVKPTGSPTTTTTTAGGGGGIGF
jgi:predicted lipoprotein with Yx(FWY)xxD motif